MELLSKNIRAFRLQEKMTQEQLAQKLGSHKSLISNYEKGRSIPDLKTLQKLADVFDVSLDTLVGRKTML